MVSADVKRTAQLSNCQQPSGLSIAGAVSERRTFRLKFDRSLPQERRVFTGPFTCPGAALIVRFVDAVETTLEIKNRLGLHLRAASTLAQALRQFSSAVTLSNGAQQVNARSVTGLMMLGAGQGTKLKVRAEGDDAQETMAALKSLFESRFGEE
jgi:phosphocarrier protein